MLVAFGRLFLIMICAIICVVFVVFGLREAAKKQEFASFPHPLRDIQTPLDIQFGPELSGTVLALDVRPRPDGSWVVAQPGQTLDGAESIWNVIDRNPDRFILMEVHHPGAPVVRQLMSDLLQRPRPTRFLINSNYLDTLRIARETSVLFLTGASVSELGRMNLLANLFLEGLIDPQFEFAILDSYNPRLVGELFRRYRFVFLKNFSPSQRTEIQKSFPRVHFLTTQSGEQQY